MSTYRNFSVMVQGKGTVHIFDVCAISREAAIADVLAADPTAEILNVKGL